MKITIKMNLDNAAFQEGGIEEVKRAINEALDHLDFQECSAVIRDINGGTVGTAIILGKPRK